ncbi:MAG: serine hydrolase [bacterium]
MLYAASLPKIAILLAAFVSFDDGTLKETEEIYSDLKAMISLSDNAAATRMIDRIGLIKINGIMMDKKYELFDKNRGGGLWVGKRYNKDDERILDPIAGLSHAATVNQVCRFYYMLAYGKIINPKLSCEMLQILSNPAIHHKFVGVIEKEAPEAILFRKSGTWKIWHSDSIMVWGDAWRRYILVAMVESPEGEQILRNLVPVIEKNLHPSQ